MLFSKRLEIRVNFTGRDFALSTGRNDFGESIRSIRPIRIIREGKEADDRIACGRSRESKCWTASQRIQEQSRISAVKSATLLNRWHSKVSFFTGIQ